MKLCLLTRFKNESHIMYEFINHYLEEGVDNFILIDDNSDDDYINLNKDWLDELIKQKKVQIKKSKGSQVFDYNLYLKEIKKYYWVILCDMDEFMFGVQNNSTLKSILETKFLKYDYINIPWKLFKHTNYFQPKSVINDNILTHSTETDNVSPSKGYKNIMKTKNISKIDIHKCNFSKKVNTYKFKDCHNKLIQNNHYRTQSEEYLRGVKEVRGGGVHKDKYKKYKKHNEDIYNKECNILKNKRKKLIRNCQEKGQIKPMLYSNSSFFLENNVIS